MKRLDVRGRRSILLPPINLDRAGFAQLDRDDPRRRIGAEEDRVLLEFHGSSNVNGGTRSVASEKFATTQRSSLHINET